MAERVRAIVLKAPGTNCERETAAALAAAGADPRILRLADLAPPAGAPRGGGALEDAALLVLPGGFSYGDDLGAGRVLAVALRTRLYAPIARFVARGGLVLGICNGFQALVKAGILPHGCDPARESPPAPTLTLAPNRSGRFETRWVHLEVTTALSPWLEGPAPGASASGAPAAVEPAEPPAPALRRLALPVAHGEGRLVAISEEALDRLEGAGQVALRYARPGGGAAEGAFPANPNGSARDIAGVIDPTGRILGLMPHPERNVAFHHHPRWTRAEAAGELGAGLWVFENGVRWARVQAAGAPPAPASAGAPSAAALP